PMGSSSPANICPQEHLRPCLTPFVSQRACGACRCRAEAPVPEEDERLGIAMEGDLGGDSPGHLHILLLRGGDDKIGARGRHPADGAAKADGQWGMLRGQRDVPPAWAVRV